MQGILTHRRQAAVRHSGGDDSKDGSKRSLRLTRGRFVVLALAAIVVLSLTTFQGSSGGKAGVTPGRRHRKLEHGVQREQEKLDLLAQQEGRAFQQQGTAAAAAVSVSVNQERGGEDDGPSTGGQQAAGGMDRDDEMQAAAAAAQRQQPHKQQAQQAEQGAGVGAASSSSGGGSSGGSSSSSGSSSTGAASSSATSSSNSADGSSTSSRSGGSSSTSSGSGKQRRKKSAYQKAVQKCQDLTCLKEAAKQERHEGQFLFPHFYILGWQKCATTSLFHHLKRHPAVMTPYEKEPEFFSYDCDYNALACPQDKQFEYINSTLFLSRALKNNMYKAAYEGSTHYAREGMRLAKSMAQVFPWVKLIMSMREPISRYISMLAHNLDKDTYTCLRKHEFYDCLELELPLNNYSDPFSAWLEAFPREQILLLQYESLTNPDHVAEHLREVKSFLGLDPEIPSNELEAHNTREQRLGAKPEGWPLKRWQYETLINIARKDAERMSDIVTTHGFGDGKRWMANWEAAWQANLEACEKDAEGQPDPQGNCIIQLT